MVQLTSFNVLIQLLRDRDVFLGEIEQNKHGERLKN